LEWSAGLLEDQRQNPSDASIERPTVQVRDPTTAVGSDAIMNLANQEEMNILSSIKKPIWWYLFGFPIWCSIAESGSKGLKLRIDDQTLHYKSWFGGKEQSSPPSEKNFTFAIFLIVFGTVALSAGLGSNIISMQNGKKEW